MTSTIDKQFTKALNAAYKLYHEDRLLGSKPRYQRIKVPMLFAAILGDWEEANKCRVDAWALSNLVRRWHPVGNKLIVDEALDEMLVRFREVDSALEEDAPEERTLAEGQGSVKIVVHDAEDDIKATRDELKGQNGKDDFEAAGRSLRIFTWPRTIPPMLRPSWTWSSPCSRLLSPF